MSKLIYLKPIYSEKAFALSKAGVYMFEVPQDTSKLEIAAEVEAQFKVGVTDVRCSNLSGKSRRTWRKRSGWQTGQKADKKRAFVQLNKDDKLPFFEEEHEHEPDKNSAKADAKETK